MMEEDRKMGILPNKPKYPKTTICKTTFDFICSQSEEISNIFQLYQNFKTAEFFGQPFSQPSNTKIEYKKEKILSIATPEREYLFAEKVNSYYGGQPWFVIKKGTLKDYVKIHYAIESYQNNSESLTGYIALLSDYVVDRLHKLPNYQIKLDMEETYNVGGNDYHIAIVYVPKENKFNVLGSMDSLRRGRNLPISSPYKSTYDSNYYYEKGFVVRENNK
jgi:hypothetical protein